MYLLTALGKVTVLKNKCSYVSSYSFGILDLLGLRLYLQSDREQNWNTLLRFLLTLKFRDILMVGGVHCLQVIFQKAFPSIIKRKVILIQL